MSGGDPFRRARTWFVDSALPLWSSAGIDPATGGFRERLTTQGAPILDVPHRTMVQCRQIAVFSLAQTLGWFDGKAIVERAVEHLLGTYYKADGRPGWIFSADLERRPVDTRRDTYAHAFALFALGWAHRVTGDDRLIHVADETLAAMDTMLRAGAGGYRDAEDSPADALGQNPHMHVFEALLVLARTTQRPQYLARAGEIYGLFTGRFFQPGPGVLAEFFDGGWNAPPLPELIWEPGHHFEWAWLLHDFGARTGLPVRPLAARLYEQAYAHGLDATGLIVDQVNGEMAVAKASRRSWPHTEAVKANAAEHEAGREGCRERAAHMMDRLLQVYLATELPGGWIDHIGADGAPLVDYMPASTLYHLAFCIAEADRVFG